MDKKSQHVGNHGGKYVGEDGLSRQFTYIDHDKKTKKSMYTGNGTAAANFREYVDNTIEEILALPAVNILRNTDLYEEFVIRSEKGIVWNEEVVKGALSINTDLLRNVYNRLWKSTIKEQYWFQEMSHKDILAGKWKKWT